MSPPRTSTVLEQLRRRTREAPEDVSLGIRLALALDREGRGREAIDEWERILDLDASVSLAWARVGRGLSARGARGAAVEAFRAAFLTTAPPGAPASLMRRGITMFKARAAALRDRASSISDRLVPPRGRAGPTKTRATASTSELERCITLWLEASRAFDADVPTEGIAPLGRLSLTLLGGVGEARGPAVSADEVDDAEEVATLLSEDEDLARILDAAYLTLELRPVLTGEERPDPAIAVLRFRPIGKPSVRLSGCALSDLGTISRRSQDTLCAFRRSGQPVAAELWRDIRRWILSEVLGMALCRLAEEIALVIFADPEANSGSV